MSNRFELANQFSSWGWMTHIFLFSQEERRKKFCANAVNDVGGFKFKETHFILFWEGERVATFICEKLRNTKWLIERKIGSTADCLIKLNFYFYSI